MYHSQSGGQVRVGVMLGGFAVGGPAGVSDTHVTCGWGGGERLFQLDYLAHCAYALQLLAVAKHRDTGGIVASILQTAQTFKQDGGNVSMSNSANNSAHNDVLDTGAKFASLSLLHGGGGISLVWCCRLFNPATY